MIALVIGLSLFLLGLAVVMAAYRRVELFAVPWVEGLWSADSVEPSDLVELDRLAALAARLDLSMRGVALIHWRTAYCEEITWLTGPEDSWGETRDSRLFYWVSRGSRGAKWFTTPGNRMFSVMAHLYAAWGFAGPRHWHERVAAGGIQAARTEHDAWCRDVVAAPVDFDAWLRDIEERARENSTHRLESRLWELTDDGVCRPSFRGAVQMALFLPLSLYMTRTSNLPPGAGS